MKSNNISIELNREEWGVIVKILFSEMLRRVEECEDEDSAKADFAVNCIAEIGHKITSEII